MSVISLVRSTPNSRPASVIYQFIFYNYIRNTLSVSSSDYLTFFTLETFVNHPKTLQGELTVSGNGNESST